MKRPLLALLCLALASGVAAAEEKKAKKEKTAAKSDKNAAQKSESSIGEWANRNKIWITHKDNDKPKSDNPKSDKAKKVKAKKD
jgi:hypothetical protein